MGMKSKENSINQEGKNVFWWKKVATVATLLAWTLGACDNMPNDEVRFNPENQSAKFKIEYHHSLWSAWIDIVNYDIYISKHEDTYMWLINQKNWRNRKKTTIETDDIDQIFDEISKILDSDAITDNTTNKKDKKIEFVKKEYKKLLNGDNLSNSWEIKIKYKSE